MGKRSTFVDAPSWGSDGRGWWDVRQRWQQRHCRVQKEFPIKQNVDRPRSFRNMAEILEKLQRSIDAQREVQVKQALLAEYILQEPIDCASKPDIKVRRKSSRHSGSTRVSGSTRLSGSTRNSGSTRISTNSNLSSAGMRSSTGSRSHQTRKTLADCPAVFLGDGEDLPIGACENNGHWEWPMSRTEKKSRVLMIDKILADITEEQLLQERAQLIDDIRYTPHQ